MLLGKTGPAYALRRVQQGFVNEKLQEVPLQTTKNVLFSVGEDQFEQVARLPALAVQRPKD
jgi:hypothetical protein